jgi:hypothetical protein
MSVSDIEIGTNGCRTTPKFMPDTPAQQAKQRLKRRAKPHHAAALCRCMMCIDRMFYLARASWNGFRFCYSEPQTIRVGVPGDLSLTRPTRWRWGRSITGSITGSVTGSITGRSVIGWATIVVVVPVTAVIPVRVRAPALVPLVAWAPVMVVCGCGRRRCLGDARGQSKCGQGHAASRQRASAQAKPWFCLLVDIHFLRLPLKKGSKHLAAVWEL